MALNRRWGSKSVSRAQIVADRRSVLGETAREPVSLTGKFGSFAFRLQRRRLTEPATSPTLTMR
jgi:hypothetical protein